MQPLDIKEYLYQLFDSHEIPYHTENEWVVPFGKLPAIKATWFQQKEIGLFDVEVLLENGTIINECFSGFGIDEKGILSGLENFCINSFHVFLSAFWGMHDSNQVEIKYWEINNVKYKVWIGNLGTRNTKSTEVSISNNLVNAIEASIKSENFQKDICWFRVFFANVFGNFTFEALKENEPWEKGLTMLHSLDWKPTDNYYSIRNFIILQKVA